MIKAARELRATIRNVADLSTTLRTVARDHASDLDTLSNQLRAAVLTMNRTAGSVELTARRLDSAVTSEEIAQLVENFSVASSELRRTTVQVRELTSRLAATQAKPMRSSVRATRCLPRSTMVGGRSGCW
jgi:uncharacterized protein (DUF3084 family)